MWWPFKSKYEKLKRTLMDIIQSSELEVGIVYFILKDILREVEKLYYTQIQKELDDSKEESNNISE